MAIEHPHTNSPLTPKSSLEKVILNHLKVKLPNKVSDKRTQVRRNLAECLTEKEVQSRIEELEKKRKLNVSKSKEIKKGIGDEEHDDCQGDNDGVVVMDDSDSDHDMSFFTDSVRCGHWLLVKFSVGKSNKSVFYVEQVVEINGSEKLISFLWKIHDSSCFVWPEHEDKMLIDDVQIEKVLSEPTFDRRQRYSFNDPF
ncbi:hypothetical protein SNE40_004758 [Patella caerulea]|uniref:Uncharacterized protein n=1 Tax=Patella caerulea TaxID=87958 RepID=A0AAN8K3N8_PATCE